MIEITAPIIINEYNNIKMEGETQFSIRTYLLSCFGKLAIATNPENYQPEFIKGYADVKYYDFKEPTFPQYLQNNIKFVVMNALIHRGVIGKNVDGLFLRVSKLQHVFNELVIKADLLASLLGLDTKLFNNTVFSRLPCEDYMFYSSEVFITEEGAKALASDLSPDGLVKQAIIDAFINVKSEKGVLEGKSLFGLN